MSADFWSSYLAGAAGIIIGNPLDVVKTRLQAGPPSPSSSDLPSQAISSRPPNTFPTRHFPSALSYLSGAPFPILGYGALNALLFTTYNRCLLLLGERSYSAPQSLTNIWLAGAAGGLATWVVSAPTELIKCRAQVQGHHNAGVQAGQDSHAVGNKPRSSWAIAQDVWRAQGVRGLYFGGTVTSIRDAVGYGFYFWSYELCKQNWPYRASGPDTKQQETAVQVLICGGIAGMVTWASIFPLDVIKTRVQTQRDTHVNHEQQPLLRQAEPGRKGAVQIAREAYAAEGLAVFFRGLGVCSLRAFVVNAVTWLVYEKMMIFMRPGVVEP